MPSSTPRGELDDPQRFAVEVEPDLLHESSPVGSSLGEAAVSGSLWTLIQVVAVKVVSLAGTLVLTHILSPEDYGVATLAVSIQTMVVLLQAYTLGDVLLARPRELARISGTAYRLSFFTSLTFAIAIVVSGPWAASYYRVPALAAACVCAAFRPLSDWTMILPLSRLRAQLRFKTISAVDAVTQTVAVFASVIMAWLGAGFASVLLPPIAFTVLRAWLYRRASPAPPSPSWRREDAPSLLKQFTLSGLGQYVHGGLIALTPLIVGSFTGQRDVGWYTMAFTLSVQINTLAGFSMGLVLQPIFAHMSDDPERQSQAFLRACRVIATLAMPVCLLQAVLAPAAFRVFLQPKWAGAVVLTQILSVGQAFFFCINPAMGLLKAQGRFTAFMVWQAIQLVVVTAAMWSVGMIWRSSPLVPIVLIGGLYHVLSGPIGVWISVRRRGGTLRACLDVFVRPFVIAALSVLPAWWLVARWVPQGKVGDAATLVVVPVATALVFSALVRRFDRAAAADCGRLLDGLKRRLRWRPAPAAA